MLSQQPLKYVREDEVRTLEQFMDDQIRFEQRRFENLKSAIIREESEETQLFQPSISKTSAAIMENRT